MKNKIKSTESGAEFNLDPKQLRQRKTKNPCPRCRMHLSLCICKEIPSLDLKTKLTLIIHYKELKRTTNTGTLALEALLNSVQIIRGERDSELEKTSALNSDYENILLFPSNESQELNSNFLHPFEKPINLIVPDGNWRQASKVSSRVQELKSLPKVMLRRTNTAKHHLRAETSIHGMSTLEAIAHAMGVIEGEKVEEALMNLYNAKLQATLKGRGNKSFEE